MSDVLTEPERRAWTRGEKWVAFGIVALCAAAFGFWKIVVAYTAPTLVVTGKTPLPDPNGFDFFVRAGGSTPVAWRPWRTLPPAFRPDTTKAAWLTAPLTARQLTTVASAPEADAGAIALMRQGLACKTLSPQSQNPLAYHPEWDRVGTLSKGVAATAYALAGRGQVAAATDVALDGLAMSSRMTHGSATDMAYTSAESASDCRRAIWPMVTRMTGSQMRAAAKRILASDDDVDTFSQILTREKAVSQARIATDTVDPLWRIRTVMNPHATVQHRETAMAAPAMVLSAYARDMDLVIAAVRGPYSPAAVPPPSGVHDADDVADEYGSFLVYWCAWCTNAADNRLLATSLALRAYKIDHGQYPAALPQLTPRYLLSVPADPFSTGALRYHGNGGRYTLYSVGPDGKDDSGKPARDAADPRAPFLVQTTSRGDIVAGVNE